MEIKEFLAKERRRAENLFATKHKPGFISKTDFIYWFLDAFQSQNYSCYYCETSIFDINTLIQLGKLKTRKTRYSLRGPILEVDKKINSLGYSPANCVLACYYCNNDKSYTLDAEEYKKYFGGNRGRYFKILMNSRSI